MIDTQNPSVDIYDLMLGQKCPAFEYGIPDTMAKLRLYWNGIQNKDNNKIFVWIFSENLSDSEAQGFSLDFLKLLSKFPGLIGVITEQNHLKLQKFSPQDSNLMENIMLWIETQVKISDNS